MDARDESIRDQLTKRRVNDDEFALTRRWNTFIQTFIHFISCQINHVVTVRLFRYRSRYCYLNNESKLLIVKAF